MKKLLTAAFSLAVLSATSLYLAPGAYAQMLKVYKMVQILLAGQISPSNYLEPAERSRRLRMYCSLSSVRSPSS